MIVKLNLKGILNSRKKNTSEKILKEIHHDTRPI